MRVRQLRRDEEEEIVVIVDGRASQVNHHLVVLLVDVLLKDGLKRWIQGLTDILKQD